MIKESFPADHPYASHISRASVLPSFDNPSDPQKENQWPSDPPPTVVVKKTYGSDRRHELVQDQMPSERKTKPWTTNYHNYYQVVRYTSAPVHCTCNLLFLALLLFSSLLFQRLHLLNFAALFHSNHKNCSSEEKYFNS